MGQEICTIMDNNQAKALADTYSFIEKTSQFPWDDFFRVLILIAVISILVFVFMIFIFKRIDKKKSLEKESELNKDRLITELAADIPAIVRVVERMAENQQDLIYRVKGYINQERLNIISRRYIEGFVMRCQLIDNLDELQREFDEMLKDFELEVVEPKVFRDYIRDSGIEIDVLQTIHGKDFKPYALEKALGIVFDNAVAESIRASKKLSLVEVEK